MPACALQLLPNVEHPSPLANGSYQKLYVPPSAGPLLHCRIFPLLVSALPVSDQHHDTAHGCFRPQVLAPRGGFWGEGHGYLSGPPLLNHSGIPHAHPQSYQEPIGFKYHITPRHLASKQPISPQKRRVSGNLPPFLSHLVLLRQRTRPQQPAPVDIAHGERGSVLSS